MKSFWVYFSAHAQIKNCVTDAHAMIEEVEQMREDLKNIAHHTALPQPPEEDEHAPQD
jgi:hypothetical protein